MCAHHEWCEKRDGPIHRNSFWHQYKLTAKAYAPFDDWAAAARQEFGPTAEVLDWNTIKTEFGGSVALLKWLMDEIGYTTRMQGGGRGVTVNGSQRWSGSRSYGIDRAEGTVPSGYLVHDQLQNNWALLGSWPADRPVMVRIPIITILMGGDSYSPVSGMEASDEPTTYVLDAYCAEFEKDNPSPGGGYAVGAVDTVAACILDKAAGLSTAARQAAVWIHTDRATYAQVRGKFRVTKKEWKAAETLVKECQH